MRPFDPARLGDREAAAWVAYYRRRWGAFLRASVGMVHAGFGMPWPATLRAAWLVLRANQVWAPYPDNDPPAARRFMRHFYEIVRNAYHATFDPAEAARLEVEWWRVHRHQQRESPGGDAEPLVGALAALYGHVYGIPAGRVRAAARYRAEAMVISDRWVADGRDPDSPALAAERDALTRGYAELRAALEAAGSAPDGRTR
jgi:hypothetical protein